MGFIHYSNINIFSDIRLNKTVKQDGYPIVAFFCSFNALRTRELVEIIGSNVIDYFFLYLGT